MRHVNHPSTVVERWSFMLALPSSNETFIIRGNCIRRWASSCAFGCMFHSLGCLM